ncbi:response regulator [Thalassococcus sp. CAU 1522]|uniref:Response regulator n=1 Tax=Thalassococcus arenae TaxID=2851652 RepID=A0ABS6N2B9_9RHOB|nr:response regulator [Thalassococcus arenae]MBV2358167.1 response regulator [Thalassococcus arenae]
MVLFQCLSRRGYLPILVTGHREALNLSDWSLASAFVLMDSLPVPAALSFCEDLRLGNRVTPVVAVLNDATRDSGIDLLECGADHFILQPLRIDGLLRTLRTIAWRKLFPAGSTLV